LKHRDNKEKVIYYDCKRPGHYKLEYLYLENKEKENEEERKKNKKF